MRRRPARIALAIAVLLLAGIAFVVTGSHLEHRRLVAEEIAAFPPPGEVLAVSAPGGVESRLHVHAEGQGAPTLVLMSGLGTSSPYFDFRALAERLSDVARVAVVERAGYGWSEISGSPRDIDTVLAETRQALAQAGERPPYVLVPHSMAGLEAAYWAARHPGEVAAIVGLDPLVPGYLDRTEERPSLSRLETVLARTGLMRDGPEIFAENFPAMVAGRLDPSEAAAAEAIFMRRTHTPDMWAELRALDLNAATVAEALPIDVPFHAVLSERGTEVWTEAVHAFVTTTGGDLLPLDAGHHVHVDRPGRAAEFILRHSVGATAG
ncbi:MAG: alpha/beta fold hydrolase [Roseicyclus sp.]